MGDAGICVNLLLCVSSGPNLCCSSSAWYLVNMHNVSVLKHNHTWAILKKHLSPKPITITVTSNWLQIVWVFAHACNKTTLRWEPFDSSIQVWSDMVIRHEYEHRNLCWLDGFLELPLALVSRWCRHHLKVDTWWVRSLCRCNSTWNWLNKGLSMGVPISCSLPPRL